MKGSRRKSPSGEFRLLVQYICLFFPVPPSSLFPPLQTTTTTVQPVHISRSSAPISISQTYRTRIIFCHGLRCVLDGLRGPFKGSLFLFSPGSPSKSSFTISILFRELYRVGARHHLLLSKLPCTTSKKAPTSPLRLEVFWTTSHLRDGYPLTLDLPPPAFPFPFYSSAPIPSNISKSIFAPLSSCLAFTPATIVAASLCLDLYQNFPTSNNVRSTPPAHPTRTRTRTRTLASMVRRIRLLQNAKEL